MKDSGSKLTLTIVCLLLGAALVMQFRTQGNIVKSILVDSTTEQATILDEMVDGNATLRKEIDTLDTQLTQYQTGTTESNLENLVEDLNRVKIVNGLIEVTGPGVELTLSGTLAPEELQDIINELRNAGAEAVVLNGQRIVVGSVVVQDRTGASLDGTSIQSPYRFAAIGDPDTLAKAVERKGGLVPLLAVNHPGLKTDLQKKDSLTAPIYDRKVEFKYARVAEKR